jgi:hypothetical protein
VRIQDLPFQRLPCFELLGFDRDRYFVDREYAGYGWALPPRITLDGRDSMAVVESPLLLALHSFDDSPALEGDILLEFVLEGSADGSVAVPLSRFLADWLPRLPDSSSIVLALCNPHRAVVTLHYAVGAVDSWIDPEASQSDLRSQDERDAGGRFRLQAESWRLALAA